MAVAGSIVVDLLMKTGSFETDANRAAKTAEKNAKAMAKAYNDAGRAIGSGIRSLGGQLLAFAGVSIGVGAAVSSIKDAIDKADSIRDLSIRIGASTETLSAFSYAAQQTGTDIDTLGKGMKILAKNAADALNPTSAQAKIFDALGISVKDAQGNLKQMGVLIPEIADKFKGLEDGTTKAALAQALFGKSGLDLTEFLNSGADGLKTFTDRAQELGIVIGQDAANAADKFNDDLSDLKTAAEGLALKVAQSLMPELDKLVVWASDFVSDGANAEAAAHGIADGFKDMAEAAHSLGEVIGFLQQIHDLLASSDRLAASAGKNLGISGFGQFLKGKFPGLYKSPDFTQNAANQSNFNGPASLQVPVLNGQSGFNATTSYFNATAGNGTTATDGKALALALSNPSAVHSSHKSAEKSEAEKQAERLKTAYDQLIAQQNEQIALFGKTDEAAKARYDTEFGALKDLAPEQKKLVIANAEKLDQMQEEVDLQKQIDESVKQHQDQVNGVLTNLQQEIDLLGKTNEERATYNALLNAGTNLSAADKQAITDRVHLLYQLGDATKQQTELMDDFRQGATDALTEFVTGTKSAGDAIKDFFNNLAAQITRAIAEQWIKQLFGETGSNSSGSAGGWFGTFAAALFGGGRAGGGDVMSGNAYLVGENGPEMFVPRTAGTVLTNKETRSMGAANSVAVTNQFLLPSTVTRQTQEQIAQRAGVASSRSISRNR